MITLIFATGLLLAPGGGLPVVSPAAPAADVAPAPSESDISLRRGRLAAYIRGGWHAGWLDREAMDEAFAKLRANRHEEDEMRSGQDGKRLTDAQRVQLDAGLADLSEWLRHTRTRKMSEPRRMR